MAIFFGPAYKRCLVDSYGLLVILCFFSYWLLFAFRFVRLLGVLSFLCVGEYGVRIFGCKFILFVIRE